MALTISFFLEELHRSDKLKPKDASPTAAGCVTT